MGKIAPSPEGHLSPSTYSEQVLGDVLRLGGRNPYSLVVELTRLGSEKVSFISTRTDENETGSTGIAFSVIQRGLYSAARTRTLIWSTLWYLGAMRSTLVLRTILF